MIGHVLDRLIGGVLLVFGFGTLAAALWALYDSLSPGYVGIALLGLAAVAFGWRRLFPNVFEPIPIDPDDPLMKAATARARQELARFTRGVSAGDKEAYVKFPLRGRSGGVEHIWGLVHSFDHDAFSVTLANEPMDEPEPASGNDEDESDDDSNEGARDSRSRARRERQEDSDESDDSDAADAAPSRSVPVAELQDWMLVAEDGATEGGYTHFAMAQIYKREKGHLPRALRKSLRNFRDIPHEELDAEPPAVDGSRATVPERSHGLATFALIAVAVAIGSAAYYGRLRIDGMHDDLVQYSTSGIGALTAYFAGDHRIAAERYRNHFARLGARALSGRDGGEARLLAGDVAGAEQLATAQLARAPRDGESLLTLAQVALARGQLDAADKLANQAATTMPRGLREDPAAYSAHHEARLVRAAASLASGRYTLAQQQLDSFMREQRPPRRVSVYLALLDGLGRLETGDAADQQWPLRTSLYHYLALFDRAHYSTMAACAEQALAANQQPAGAHLALALVHLRDERDEAALQALRAAIRLQPDHADAMHIAAGVYENRGDLVNAYEMLDSAWQARRLDGWHHDALMAFLSRKLGDYRRALEVAQAYVAAAPRDAQGLFWAGHVHWLTGDLSRSTEYLVQAAAVEPDDALLHEGIGQNHQTSGRFEEAIAAYRRAIAVAPRRMESKRFLAGLFMNRSDYAAAIPLYEAAFALATPTAAQRGNLCAAYAGVSRYDEAWRCFELVRRADPANALAARLMPEIANNRSLRQSAP